MCNLYAKIIQSTWKYQDKSLEAAVNCVWEVSGPAIYKTAVLPILYVSLVRYCRQPAVFPGHCTILQYAGVKDYLRMARRYFILSRNVLLCYPNNHQFSQVPAICPFLVPDEFCISHSFESNGTLGPRHYILQLHTMSQASGRYRQYA